MSIPLSVIMPVKNSGAFIGESVDSVCAQTCGDFEFIVVDDGSTDDSMDIVRSRKDARISIVPGPGRGVAAAITAGLGAAQGEFFARIDADDVCEPDRFAEQLEFLKKEKTIQVVGSDFTEINETGETIARFAAVNHPELAAASLLVENPLIHSSVMGRRAVVNDLGGYRETASEDYELWCRLVRAGGRLTSLPKSLIRWRWHESAVTKSNAGGVRASALKTYEIFRDWFVGAQKLPPVVGAAQLESQSARAGLLARRMAWLYVRFGAFFFDTENFKDARAMLITARDNARLCRGESFDAPLRSSYPTRKFERELKTRLTRIPALARLVPNTGPFSYKPLER